MKQERQHILDVIAEHAGRPVSEIPANAEFADIGLDSLKFIMVLLAIEQRIKRKLADVAAVGRLRTVQDLLDLADGESSHA